MNTDKKQVVHYNLIDFLIEVQTLVKQGYEFDFKTNLHVPQMIGSMFHCYMLKGQTEDMLKDKPEDMLKGQTEDMLKDKPEEVVPKEEQPKQDTNLDTQTQEVIVSKVKRSKV